MLRSQAFPIASIYIPVSSRATLDPATSSSTGPSGAHACVGQLRLRRSGVEALRALPRPLRRLRLALVKAVSWAGMAAANFHSFRGGWLLSSVVWPYGAVRRRLPSNSQADPNPKL